MNIKRIVLRNFKCFKEIEINPKKINLITGANSSGKSSMLFGVLGSIQSGEFPFSFSPNGKYIKMGDYADIVHKHEKGSWIGVDIAVENTENNRLHSFQTEWSNSHRNLPRLRLLNYENDDASIKIDKGEYKKKFNVSYKLKKEVSEDEELTKKARNFQQVFNNFSKQLKEVTDDNKSEIEATIDKYMQIKSRINFKVSNLDEIKNGIRDNGDLLMQQLYTTMSSIFVNFDSEINFISSFRSYPDRTYYETSKNDLKVTRFGENYVDQIMFWAKNKSPEYDELISNLRAIKLVHNVVPNSLEGARFELQIINKPNGVRSSINDVGFGVSQFLPIVVADLQLESDGTLFIAQPEIHLHPTIQAEFGTYLEMQLNKNPNRQYFIETHSEYLINRIRLLIVEGKLSENDVNLIYVRNSGVESECIKIDLKQNGEMRNAPKDFFETYMMDVLDISLKS